jgi:glycerophosphoryl diester phosphodiesterase
MGLLERIGREKLIFGHRGTPDEAPENTLAGFKKAVELGLDGVELDARLCRTGEIVVFHDDEVDKLTDGSGRVDELAFDELRHLDAGARFEGFSGEKIPTLEEVLETLSGKMIVNIELKTGSIAGDGLEARVATLVWKMGLQSSVILSSFNPFSVRRIVAASPGLKVALLFAEDQPIHLRRAWALRLVGVDGVHPRYPLVSEKLMRRARAKGWFVNTWTVDDASVAKRMFEAGVAAIVTNNPRRMRDELSA